MTELLLPFRYPDTPHRRRHGPRGYRDYKQFKPSLRDEFAFRCVYCLFREKWSPEGHAGFGVEHLRSQSAAPRLRTRYDNLLYACTGCNASKRECESPLNPCADAFDTHLRVHPDGRVEALTPQGKLLVRLCHLNREKLVEGRLWYLRAFAIIVAHPASEDTPEQRLLRDEFRYPSDLPDLTRQKPPGDNSRPEGASTCFYQRRKFGQLPEVY